ncbi:DUF6404 family protein [Marinomonas ostreistagni]|uniref:DUF6404 family protein n=1 Tax=Marinomonas ostreistagni TaxID=359209 RepID=UPI00195139F2|nr:hypothetical protein [Marinomonas ostreistagni]
MSFETRLANAHAELQAQGVWLSNYKPPMFSLLRMLGIKVPPPYYLGFHLNAVIAFWYFAIIIFLVMYFGLLGSNDSLRSALDKAALWGIIYGVGMATFYAIRRRKLQLSDWSSL